MKNKKVQHRHDELKQFIKEMEMKKEKTDEERKQLEIAGWILTETIYVARLADIELEIEPAD